MFTPQNLRPPTSADVARAAGVSRATVSFVLNDKPDARISEATRQRVLHVARDLGYTPSRTAQALRSGRTRGVLLPIPVSGVAEPHRTLLQLLLRRGSARDLGIEVLVTGQQSLVEAAQEWAGRRPRAVIVSSDLCSEEATTVLRHASVQALVVIGPEPVSYAPCLVLDEEEYGTLAVEYLYSRGHRSVGVLGVDAGSPAGAMDRRRDAIVAAADAREMVVEPVEASTDPTSLRDWAHGWRYASDRPSAVIAYDDMHAFAAVAALLDAGLKVPDDVAVIGADNHPVGPLFRPALTTIGRDMEALVGALMDAVERLLDGETVERVPVPALEVIARRSA